MQHNFATTEGLSLGPGKCSLSEVEGGLVDSVGWAEGTVTGEEGSVPWMGDPAAAAGVSATGAFGDLEHK